MTSKRIHVTLILAFMLAGAGAASAGADKKVEPDPRAQKLVADLLAGLTAPDDAARLAAVLPLVHKSLLTADGKDLVQSVKDYGYKKASQSAKLYRPVIDRVEPGNPSTVAGEEGRVNKYFIAKKEGVAGRPAPVQVFFPKAGGDPKVVDMGSL